MPKKHAHNSTDSLQQKLLSTRYSIIDDMLNVSSSLSKEQLKLKSQKQKIQELNRRILQIENAENLNNRQGMEYQERLHRLQDTQNMAVALLGVKVASDRRKEEVLMTRRNVCSEMKTNLEQAKNRAMEIFEKRKSARVQRIKREQYEHSLRKNMLDQSDAEYRRNKSSQIKQAQMMAKERLKRYEQFRLAQARFNYDEKKSQLLLTHAQKVNQLKGLQAKVSNVEELFRKTQVLNQEVEQIQSLYITGQ